MKNRMRESRSFGSVRGGGSDASAYSENRATTGRSLSVHNSPESGRSLGRATLIQGSPPIYVGFRTPDFADTACDCER